MSRIDTPEHSCGLERWNNEKRVERDKLFSFEISYLKISVFNRFSRCCSPADRMNAHCWEEKVRSRRERTGSQVFDLLSLPFLSCTFVSLLVG